VAEPEAYISEPRFAAAVLRGVVQERGHDLILGPTVLADDGRHGEQVGDVGDAGALAGLVAVQAGGVVERPLEILSV
jgi:hypothetical protein